MDNNIRLWENDVPLFDPSYGQEEPTLTPYLNGRKGSGCVIVLPGGGYTGRADHEGGMIARMYNEVGISSFVLNYRVAPYHHPAELYDAQRAVRLVRHRAAEYGIDPYKIAVLGFSAGGHLAVNTCELFDAGMTGGDEIDRESSRPDAGIFCYPVVTLIGRTHAGSRDNLLGENPDPALLRKLSGECSVPDDMPPAFIWHTVTDDGVDVTNSLNLAIAMHEKNIGYEMHIYPHGGHGLGLAENDSVVRAWAADSQRWLLGMGY